MLVVALVAFYHFNVMLGFFAARWYRTRKQ